MRIVLISDIHFGVLSTTDELAVHGEPIEIGDIKNAKPLFQGLIDILKIEQPKYLFIAGDLTSSGSPLEFKNCQKKVFELGNEVGVQESDIIFCLGNHDIDWRISKIIDSYNQKSSATYSDDDMNYLKNNYHKLSCFWSANKENISQSYASEYETPLTGVVDNEDCTIFVLNSGHLCTNDQKYKHGSLSNEQLNWFRDSIKTYGQSTKPKIVLLHHHPCNYPYPLTGLDISALEEGSELIQICGEQGIDLILHGHRHHPKAMTRYETNWKKPVTYICSGSLSVNASHRLHGAIPNTFHVVDYENSNKITLRNYLYKPSTGWSLIKDNCPETPVDGTMLLGEIVSDETAVDLIKSLPQNKPIQYHSLNDKLFYLSLNKLNELISTVHGNGNVIHGRFPYDVFIHRPGGDSNA